jgi:enterochelin esterase-like enzyme
MSLADGRSATVYLPPEASVPPPDGHPLLILHDNQNLFDPDRAHVRGQHWRVAETAEALIASRAIRPIAICGVDHGGPRRVREMTPTPGPRREGGDAADYLHMIVRTLLPRLRREFPVRRDRAGTGIGGASLGGLVSLLAGVEWPGVFGSFLVMSPSVWWDGDVVLRRIARAPEGFAGARMWIDAGTGEGRKTIADARRLSKLLRRVSPPDDPIVLRYLEAPGADHSERAWAERLPQALTFLFGDTR